MCVDVCMCVLACPHCVCLTECLSVRSMQNVCLCAHLHAYVFVVVHVCVCMRLCVPLCTKRRYVCVCGHVCVCLYSPSWMCVCQYVCVCVSVCVYIGFCFWLKNNTTECLPEQGNTSITSVSQNHLHRRYLSLFLWPAATILHKPSPLFLLPPLFTPAFHPATVAAPWHVPDVSVIFIWIAKLTGRNSLVWMHLVIFWLKTPRPGGKASAIQPHIRAAFISPCSVWFRMVPCVCVCVCLSVCVCVCVCMCSI